MFASDIGGVSATANPVANSSGSVTNQAIQVLQGPYITNTYGNGIQCQGPTMNLTPFITGNIAVKRPYEDTWMDPVYNNVDANNDDVPDNPGGALRPGRSAPSLWLGHAQLCSLLGRGSCLPRCLLCIWRL